MMNVQDPLLLLQLGPPSRSKTAWEDLNKHPSNTPPPLDSLRTPGPLERWAVGSFTPPTAADLMQMIIYVGIHQMNIQNSW